MSKNRFQYGDSGGLFIIAAIIIAIATGYITERQAYGWLTLGILLAVFSLGCMMLSYLEGRATIEIDKIEVRSAKQPSNKTPDKTGGKT